MAVTAQHPSSAASPRTPETRRHTLPPSLRRCRIAALSIGLAAPLHAIAAPAAAVAGILDDPWRFQTPDGMTFLLLVLVLLLTAISGIGIYRAMLRTHVQRIEHPQTLAWSLAFIVAGLNLWIFFAILYYKALIGIGIPAVLAIIFLFLAIMMLALNRVKQWVTAVVVVIAVLVAFQLLLA